MIKKASTLLQSGNIMGSVFQPFECHIPYKQQFMIDYNLFGMNFVRFAKPRYRNDISLKKQSVCPLEFDVLAEDILNQYDIIPGNVPCNPGIQYIRDEETKRDGRGKGEVIESNLTQNRVDVEPTITDLNYKEKLKALLKSKSSQSSGTSTSGTILNETSLLDISVLDNTQLEEHAQMFLQLWKDNDNEHNKQTVDELDDDCVLSQRKTNADEDEPDENDDDLNFTLLDFMNSLDMKEMERK